MNNGGCDLDERLIATIQRLPHVSLFDLEAGKGCINLWGQCERTTLSWLKILLFSCLLPLNCRLIYLLVFRSRHYYCLQPRQFLWFWLNTPSSWLTAGYLLWFQCKILSLKWKGPLLLRSDCKSSTAWGPSIIFAWLKWVMRSELNQKRCKQKQWNSVMEVISVCLDLLGNLLIWST